MSDFDAGLIFEQDPVQIIDALLPLYLNCTLLRSLQARSRGACEARGSWLWPWLDTAPPSGMHSS